MLSLVDLSIAVSGSQGSPPPPVVPGRAARISIIGASPPFVKVVADLHNSHTNGARVAPGRENAPCWSATSCSPTDFLRSTIGARGLNFRVRNGTGCTSPAMVADQQEAFSCQGRGRPPRALRAAQRDADELPQEARSRSDHRNVEGRARPISTARLSASRRLHLQPIDLVVYKGSYRKENSSWDGLPA